MAKRRGSGEGAIMANERDELAKALQEAAPFDCPIGFTFNGAASAYGNRFANAVLNAGYRKPRIITTAEELDALPEGSIIRENNGAPIVKVQSWWECGPDVWDDPELPATLLWEPN